MGEAPTHPHAVARAAFVEIDGVPHPAPAPRFSGTPSSSPRPALAGESAVEVLGRWGVDEAQVESLRADGVVGGVVG